MLNETIITTPNVANLNPFKRISWTAIFAGAFVGIGLSFLLGLFGAAIGLSIFTMGANGAVTLAVGGLIGIIICIIVAMLIAGYTAGYLGRLYCPQRNLGILYGFVAWTVALILSALFTTFLSSYVAASTNLPVVSPQVSGASTSATTSAQANKLTNSTLAKTNGTTKTQGKSTKENPAPNTSANTVSNTAPNTTSPLTVHSTSSQPNGNQVITVTASPGVLAWGTFVIFLLFFLGALASCIGGCWGMGCRRED